MTRKRREYFHAGVRLVWMVDPLRRSVAVFSSATPFVVRGQAESLDGGYVLPGLTIQLADVFAVLDGPGTEISVADRVQWPRRGFRSTTGQRPIALPLAGQPAGPLGR